MIGAAAISSATTIGMGIYSEMNKPGPVVPKEIPFTEDPFVGQTQDRLYGLGTGILEGKTPESFSDIGKMGSPQFENMLSLMKKDVTTGVQEDIVRRGVSRGGVGAAATAKAVGEQSTKMRFADMLQAIEGQKFLLGTGVSALSGVRGAALTNQGMLNKLNVTQAGFGLEQQKIEDAKEAQRNAALSEIISSVVGTAGTVGGALASKDKETETEKEKKLGSALVPESTSNSQVSDPWA